MTTDLLLTSDPRLHLQFKALGDPTRLRIFEMLCRCRRPVAIGDSGAVHLADGPTVGEICCEILGGDKITSTLSHHLKELRNAGLICMERRGKHVFCRVDAQMANQLFEFFDAMRKGVTDNACC